MNLDLSDPRTQRALVIAAGADQWLRCRRADGRKAFGVPSQRTKGQYHLADKHECSCHDFQWHREPCKHVRAIWLYCALVKATAPVRR